MRELAADIIFIVDNGYIRRSVIVDATERLAIRTPRYWLAPAVVAVAAWLKDDEALYLNSISSALNLDPGKTALFMILLLRHQERAGAMREWIGRYLVGLEPTNLPTDFAVIPVPLDDEMPDDADSDEGNEDRYASGFPEWTPQPPIGARQPPGRRPTF